jgi:hypothetical protein
VATQYLILKIYSRFQRMIENGKLSAIHAQHSGNFNFLSAVCYYTFHKRRKLPGLKSRGA